MASPVSAALFALQDPTYRAFHCKLIPTIDPDRVIGVRTPALRQFARKFAQTDEAAPFLQQLPHHYYEENNLHAFLLEQIRDFDACAAAVDAFLPFVDNWATCDALKPPALGKNLPALDARMDDWLRAAHPFTVRFGINMRMTHFLGDAFRPAQAAAIAALRSDDYYVNMGAAWYFATALAFQRDAIWPIFAAQQLPVWTHNKAIQKCIESRRISAADKAALRGMRRR